MAIDLKAMSHKELKQLKRDVEKALKNAEARERQEALKAAEKAAAEFGYSLKELSDGTATRSRSTASKSAPKYRNPENPDQTWTGRGRRPQWIHDAQARGTELSELEI